MRSQIIDFPLIYALFSHRYYARFGKSDPRINQTVEEKQYSICDSSQQNRQTLPMANASRNGMLSALDRPQFTDRKSLVLGHKRLYSKSKAKYKRSIRRFI